MAKLDPYDALAACQSWGEFLDGIETRYPGLITEIQQVAEEVASRAGLKAPMRVLLGKSPDEAVERMFKHPSVYYRDHTARSEPR